MSFFFDSNSYIRSNLVHLLSSYIIRVCCLGKMGLPFRTLRFPFLFNFAPSELYAVVTYGIYRLSSGVHICMYVCVYVCMCVCIYIYIYIFLCGDQYSNLVLAEWTGFEQKTQDPTNSTIICFRDCDSCTCWCTRSADYLYYLYNEGKSCKLSVFRAVRPDHL